MIPVITIAENEFSRIARNPLIIIFCLLMLTLAVVNAMGCSVILPGYVPGVHCEHAQIFFIGVGNFYWIVSMLFAFLSVCIGVISMADERSKGTLGVLISKPLYRKDIIMGKYLGICTFLLLLIIFIVTLYVSLIIIAYRGPDSFIDMIIRVGTMIFLLFLHCNVIVGIIMFFGILLNKAQALIMSFIFLAYEWLPQTPMTESVIKNFQFIDPIMLYLHVFYYDRERALGLLSVSVPFDAWFTHSLPLIVLMVAEVVLVILVNSMLFTREDV